MGSQMALENHNHNLSTSRAQENTDAGNRNRFVSAYKDELCFVVETKQWLEKRGMVWVPATPGSLQARALSITHQIEADANEVQDPNIKAATLSWVKRSQSCSKLNAMISMSSKWPAMEVRSNQFDSAIHKLATDNAVVNLASSQCSDQIENPFWRRKANAKWDENAECPKFSLFLEEVFCGDPDLIDWVQLALGYSITGSTDEQVMFLAYGNGANGKSTLLELVKEIIGDFAQVANINEFMSKDKHGIRSLEQVAVLDGVRLAIASEIEGNGQLNEALMKRLTGGDTLTAARLHQSQFTFKPQFKIWMLVNYLPRSQDNSDGFWRRIRVIPFNAKFIGNKRRIDLKQQLLEERDGILNWLVTGARRWHARQLQQGGSGLGTCQAVEDATAAFRRKNDPLRDFLDACVTYNPSGKVPAGALYEAYRNWSEFNALGRTLSSASFAQNLQSQGFHKKRTSNGIHYSGLELNK